MDLIKKALLMRSSDPVQDTSEHDRSTARMCFATSAGLLLVAALGWLAELALGVGGHLAGLILLSIGYLCCGLKQQTQIWLAQRMAAKKQALRMPAAVATGCLSHAEVLPPRRNQPIGHNETRLARAEPLSCI